MSTILLIDTSGPKPENISVAQSLSPPQRQVLATQVLARAQPVSQLARDNGVSRKFLYQQADKAQDALDDAFDTPKDDSEILFWLPVTRAWLRQLVLALTLICHASYRGVVEVFRDLLDTSISVGSIHNIVREGVTAARSVNAQEDLSAITIGAHDEIFQSRQPILVGCDVGSTYCYLLSQEEARDKTTWGVHLLDLEEKGLHLSHTIADFGKGLRAGQAEAWPGVACWGDVFHASRQLSQLATYLENRAIAAMSTREKLEKKMAAAKKKGKGNRLSRKLSSARRSEAAAVVLTDDVKVLVQWMREDVLAVVGPDFETRAKLYDYIVEELTRRQSQASHRIGPVARTLENGRDDLLAFAARIDEHLDLMAEHFQVPPSSVRKLFEGKRSAVSFQLSAKPN